MGRRPLAPLPPYQGIHRRFHFTRGSKCRRTVDGLCVPGMGMHSMLAEETNQVEPFGASTLVGYYKGNGSSSVPGGGADMAWPSRFEAVYDASTQTYRFTYSGFGGD